MESGTRFFFFEVGDCEFDKVVEAAGEEGGDLEGGDLAAGTRGEQGGELGGVASLPIAGRSFEGCGAGEAGACFAGFCPHMRPRLDIRENLLALPWSSPLARHMNSWNSIVPLAETSRKALSMVSSPGLSPLCLFPLESLGLLLPFLLPLAADFSVMRSDPFPRGRETKSSSAMPDTKPVPWLRRSKARQQASSRIGTQ